MIPDSSPVIAADGTSVIYIQAVTPSPPVVSRSIVTRAETTLFSVPLGSLLWTLNYRTGTLLFSIASGPGGRHIVEYSPSGDTIRNFDVPSGFQDYHACISPDGSTLAFIRIADATGLPRLTVRAASDGSSATRPMRTFINGEVPLAVRWLDNSQILVSSRVGSSTIENVIQNVSTGVGSIATGLGLNATPDPSGEHVASLQGGSGALDVWLSRVDGEAMTRLTESVNTKRAINWSADGRTLVYETLHGQPPVASLELLLLPPLQ
jgi:Tol biopolymer transport system component